jgi:hypothetical protein
MMRLAREAEERLLAEEAEGRAREAAWLGWLIGGTAIALVAAVILIQAFFGRS